VGVASFPDDADDREALIAAADHALYVAKESGRNRVRRHRESMDDAFPMAPAVVQSLVADPTLSAMRDLAATVDARSAYTRGHSSEVTQYAMTLAEALALTDAQKDALRIAGLMHNLGVVGVPDRILAKPGPLTEEERKVIQAHPGLAELLDREAPRFKGVAQAILYHHERWDGHGYPRGLKGEEIPRLARILGLAEAYHAMTSVRPYRRRLTRAEAVQELRAGAGTQFDPHLVERFIEIIENGEPRQTPAPREQAA
jgi:HD-GYP domain-containing protein (c-di-GMP phosphodiesterase class II)